MSGSGEYEILKPDDGLPGKVVLYEKPGKECFTKKHRHRGLEIDYLIRGRMWVCINSKDYDLLEGEYILIDSESAHQTCGKFPNKTVRYLVVLFSYSYIKNYFKDFDLYHFDLDKSQQAKLKIKEQLNSILFELENESKFSKLKISCAMNIILSTLFAKCSEFRSDAAERIKITENDYAQKAICFIKENFTDKITLEDISAYVGLKPTYFSRFFRKATGKTFINYLNLVRLENALIDIQENGKKEKTAALENGFSDVKSFISVFKSIYGCSLTEYIKKYKEEPPISKIFEE